MKPKNEGKSKSKAVVLQVQDVLVSTVTKFVSQSKESSNG